MRFAVFPAAHLEFLRVIKSSEIQNCIKYQIRLRKADIAVENHWTDKHFIDGPCTITSGLGSLVFFIIHISLHLGEWKGWVRSATFIHILHILR